MVKIVPTIGRVVLYFPSEADRLEGMGVYSEDPCAALVAFVHSDECVNLTVSDHDGISWARRMVPINIEIGVGATLSIAHAGWMDYQLGQAAKAEKAEAALAAARVPHDVRGNPITMAQMDAQMGYSPVAVYCTPGKPL